MNFSALKCLCALFRFGQIRWPHFFRVRLIFQRFLYEVPFMFRLLATDCFPVWFNKTSICQMQNDQKVVFRPRHLWRNCEMWNPGCLCLIRHFFACSGLERVFNPKRRSRNCWGGFAISFAMADGYSQLMRNRLDVTATETQLRNKKSKVTLGLKRKTQIVRAQTRQPKSTAKKETKKNVQRQAYRSKRSQKLKVRMMRKDHRVVI